MENQRAIPQGYMTTGEVAKRMGVTVRTLQHYDREGLLAPSCISEGGRRLYTNKDVVKLHQILSLKHLGFSLSDIKNRLISLDKPAEVANILTEQAAIVQKKIEALSESLNALETLREEVLRMQFVDFQKYADIIVNLQMKNDYYWLIKHFDDHFTQLQNEAIELRKMGVPADSERGQQFAKTYWDMITEFTGGNMSMLPQLMELGQFKEIDGEWKEKQEFANEYIGQVLDVYFSKAGIIPFEEGAK